MTGSKPTDFFREQRIRDPLHDLIEFGADEFENAMWDVIQSSPFQRLRRIKQLGFTEFVFPGATHSRFSHSVGVFHTARRLMRIIQRHLKCEGHYLESRAQIALAASLVHDVGHGPFSHAIEEVGKALNLKYVKKHETVSDALIRSGPIADALKSLGSGFANDVADVVGSDGPRTIYSAVVSSQFDADRLDYMRRDRLMTGTQHAGIDFEWLLANLEVGSVARGVDETQLESIETFVLGPKAIYAAEAYVLGLFQLYPTIYFHKTTRGFEKLFSQLLLRLFDLANNGSEKRTGLDTAHPLLEFCREPDSLDRILMLDDTCVTGAYSMIRDAEDTVLSKLANCLLDRKRLPCIDVRQKIEQALGLEAASEGLLRVEAACKSIESKVDEWLKCSHSGNFPRILSDKGERVPYRELDESKGPLNQIRIRISDAAKGRHVDLRERSKVVRAIDPFKFYRVYVTDDESRNFVHGLIEEEVANVTKS